MIDNKNKNKVGRPLKIKTVKELDEKIEAYFKYCDDNNKPYTISGLALFLDTTRETINEYSVRDEYVDAIKKAKERCQNYAEESLFTNPRTAGIIFNLKNNYHWVDKQEIVTTSKSNLDNLDEEELKELKDKYNLN